MVKLRDIIEPEENPGRKATVVVNSVVEKPQPMNFIDPKYAAMGRLQGTLEGLQEDIVTLLERLEAVSREQIQTAEMIAQRERELQESWQKRQERQRKEDQKLLIK